MRISGSDFALDCDQIERALKAAEPEPIREHFVVVAGRRWPPKQVLAKVTGLDRADFTTHQARSALRRAGFGVHRLSQPTVGAGTPEYVGGRHPEAVLLDGYRGRWVAQDGLEILFDSGSVDEVVRWLRRHGRRARVWRVPTSPSNLDGAGHGLV